MVTILLKIQDKDGNILLEKKGEDAVSFVYDAEYNEGDVIILETIPANKHIVWQVDDALGAAMCLDSSMARISSAVNTLPLDFCWATMVQNRA